MRRPESARMRLLAMLFVALLAGAQAVAAQDTLSTRPRSGPATVPFCFSPRTGASCSGFMITEIDIPARQNTTGGMEILPNGDSVYRAQLRRPVHVTLGAMRNLGTTAAMGAALFTGGSTEHPRYGAVLRYRRWLGEMGALDVSAGPIVAPVHGANLSDSEQGHGGTADVAVMFFDWVGISARAEVLRTPTTTARGAYLGVRLGAWPAVLGALGVAVLAVVGAASGT
jgi:hypothetical protein